MSAYDHGRVNVCVVRANGLATNGIVLIGAAVLTMHITIMIELDLIGCNRNART